MTTTLSQAKDEIYAIIKEVWDPTNYEVLWDDLTGEPPDTTDPWIRTSIYFSDGGQGSLCGEEGATIWSRTGFVTIQLFSPSGQGMDNNLSYGQEFLNAYEGVRTASGVWFRNARYNPIGISGNFFQGNAIVNFMYDDVK